MKLRKPCEHGYYDKHRYSPNGDRYFVTCPGGEFLAESDLLAEVSDAKLQEEWVRRTTKGRVRESAG